MSKLLGTNRTEILFELLDVPKFDPSWIKVDDGVLKYVYDLSVKSRFTHEIWKVKVHR